MKPNLFLYESNQVYEKRNKRLKLREPGKKNKRQYLENRERMKSRFLFRGNWGKMRELGKQRFYGGNIG